MKPQPIWRLVCQKNNNSPIGGVIYTDTVRTDDIVKFVTMVNNTPGMDHIIIDYSRLLIGEGATEVIENPTGGYVGKITDPSQKSKL